MKTDDHELIPKKDTLIILEDLLNGVTIASLCIGLLIFKFFR